MGGKFWSLLEISWDILLDTYIHHLQLNWKTSTYLKNWATFMVLGQSDPFLSFYTIN